LGLETEIDCDGEGQQKFLSTLGFVNSKFSAGFLKSIFCAIVALLITRMAFHPNVMPYPRNRIPILRSKALAIASSPFCFPPLTDPAKLEQK
jgi:hypothetical protein